MLRVECPGVTHHHRLLVIIVNLQSHALGYKELTSVLRPVPFLKVGEGSNCLIIM